MSDWSSDCPLQSVWCRPGRRWAFRWSRTPQQSATSASSRCTLSWWASGKSLTSVVWATWYQPAHNTAPLPWQRNGTYKLNIHSCVTVKSALYIFISICIFKIFYVQMFYAHIKLYDNSLILWLSLFWICWLVGGVVLFFSKIKCINMNLKRMGCMWSKVAQVTCAAQPIMDAILKGLLKPGYTAVSK